MGVDELQSLEVYSVSGDGKDESWVQIGLAHPHPDGLGFSLSLKAIPLGGKLILRRRKPRTQRKAQPTSLSEQVEAFERGVIERCLLEVGGRISSAVKQLNVPRRTLNEKMTRLGISRRRVKKSLQKSLSVLNDDLKIEVPR